MKKTIIFVVILSLLFLGCVSTNSRDQNIIESQVTKISFNSKSLGKEMMFNIYLPKGYNIWKKYPVLYMMHGYSDNEDAWMPNLKLKEVADRLIENDKITPLIIVMPQIDKRAPLNTHSI